MATLYIVRSSERDLFGHGTKGAKWFAFKNNIVIGEPNSQARLVATGKTKVALNDALKARGYAKSYSQKPFNVYVNRYL